MVQGVPSWFIVSAKKVGVKNVLPGAATPGTRLDLGQADIAQREYGQGLEQRACNVLDAESNRGFVGAGQNTPGSADQEEAGEVAFVVFNTRGQDFPAVSLGCLHACDSRRIAQS